MGVRANDAGGLNGGFELPIHIARALMDAARAPYPAVAIQPILDRYGFMGSSYIVASGEHNSMRGEIVWSTYAAAWPALYRSAGYAAVDPRLIHTRHRVTPYLWDAADSAEDHRARSFVRGAAGHGIRGSVVISLHDGATGQVALTFDSATGLHDSDRREAVIASLPDLTLIAMVMHEGVLSWRIARAAAHKHAGPRLTPRECECLKFAACGMTSADIGNKLSLTERTVNFHFGKLRRKLGALNRPEAIAKGVAMGIVALD